jgi:phage baseplate assembly protein W
MAIGYSVKLPLQLDPQDGPYTLNRNLASVVKQNVKMVIFTSPGERIMDSNFGVGIRNYLFEPLTEITKINVKDRIIKQLNTYLPFVEIKSLSVFSSEEAPNTLSVKMEYSFPSSDIQILDLLIR